MGKARDSDDVPPAIPVVATSPPTAVNHVESRIPDFHREGFIDWRTIDPAMFRGEGIPTEELLTYREKLDELLQDGAGHYVLVVGREVISLFQDLDTAAAHAAEHFGGRTVLIKKIAASEPVHTLGGARLESARVTGAATG